MARCSGRRRTVGAGLLGLVLGVGGCTSGSDAPPAPSGTFALPTASEVTCLEHQTEPPGPAYTGGVDGDTAAIFSMLRYWASNGGKPYCDGEPAGEIDEQWRDLVVELGAARPADPTSGPSGTPGPTEPGPEPEPEPTTT